MRKHRSTLELPKALRSIKKEFRSNKNKVDPSRSTVEFTRSTQINIWKKDTFGKVEERKVSLLDDIRHIDLKEETVGLDDHDCRCRSLL